MRRVWDVIGPLLIGLLLGWAVFQGIQAHQLGQAVCALRLDLTKRVEQGKKFEHDHPHGGFGFSPAQIHKSISDQQRTVRALSPITC